MHILDDANASPEGICAKSYQEVYRLAAGDNCVHSSSYCKYERRVSPLKPF